MADDGRLTPQGLYGHIEAWWGAEFDDKLIHHMVNAPRKHQRAFAESLPVQLNFGFPEVPPGKLRPMIARNPVGFGLEEERINIALRLLLYAHEVVIDVKDLPEFNSDDWSNESYASSLERLRRIRPLVIDGSIKFSAIASRGFHPSLSQFYADFIEHSVLRALAEELGPLESAATGELSDLAETLHAYTGGMHAVYYEASRHMGHTLALSRAEEVFRSVLLERPISDGRHITLNKLASLAVPDMGGDIGTLIKIRQSEAHFASWREHLLRALYHVDGLHDDDSLAEASEVVFDELSSGLTDVRKATEKSAALQSIKAGMYGLSIMGISAGTTDLLGGNPWVGLASGAAAKAADTARNYIKTEAAPGSPHP